MIFTLLYWVIFILILDEGVSPQYIGYAIYINCVFFSCLLIWSGLGTNILDGLSNNYISVILLFPLLIYYIKLEEKGGSIPLLPAILVWITCLLAVGRGGILASSVLLLGILIYLFFYRQRWKKKEAMYFYRFIISLSFILTIQLAVVFYDVILEWSVFQRFAKHGFYGTGRAGIWDEYLYYVNHNLKNFLFGVDFDSLFQMIRYKHNLHNSFLNVHAYNGIIMLVYIIVCLTRQIILGIQSKRWIMVVCIVAFCLRAFTDKIFWGGVIGTPLLFFLMWNPNKKLKYPMIQKERLY